MVEGDMREIREKNGGEGEGYSSGLAQKSMMLTYISCKVY